jgi:hypothetical protein
MKTNSGTGLSILAGGLAFVGSAHGLDLVVNGSFEDGTGWIGTFGTYNYSAAYFRGPPVPAAELPGDLWSWRHAGPAGFSEPLSQTVDLLTGLSVGEIDGNRGRYVFSAWLASYGQPNQNPERPYVTAQFFDAFGTNQIGATVVHDRSTSQNFTTFADGTTTFDTTAHEHNWAKYVRTAPVPPGARFVKIGVTRSPNAGVSGNPDTYTDLVKFDVSAVPSSPPSLDSATPIGPNTRPDAAISIVLQDGTSQVNTNSIQLTFDGSPASPSITKTGGTTTIQYDPPGLLASASAHTYRIVFADNAASVTRQTNDFNFSVVSYYNILLPAAIHLETFDSASEGGIPTDWTTVSYGNVPDPACNPGSEIGTLQDLNSGCYSNWVVVDSTRFRSAMYTYTDHALETDYQRVLSTNIANVVNGAIVENLAQGNVAFGNSGYRGVRDANESQIVYLFSKDFDLTGHNNVYLAWHSLWEQNQDSVGAVEYSIDEGATWLPIVYLIDGADIIRDSDGNIDGRATLAEPRADTATYIDPNDSSIKGGYYGAFIGVASNLWSTLGSFISPRVDNNPIESKRVEVHRLPAADNQSKVRLRFAHAGADSWYFGIDNVGLYSITTVSAPSLSGPTSVTDYYGNTVTFRVTPQGMGPFTYQWRRAGSDLSGQTSSSLVLSNVQTGDAVAYDVIVGYPGGSITSTQAVLTLAPSPANVIGQWDFNLGDLSASCGQPLQYFDTTVEFNTFFGASDGFGIPMLGGESVNVMSFPGRPPEGPMGGYKMLHGLAGNGAGSNVNQYTLIMDLLYPETSHNLRRALLQTSPNNTGDADFRVNEANGIGVDGIYHGTVRSNQWHRIALAVDLSGPGPKPIVAKFIDGVKVGQQTLSAGRDARWSLSADPLNPWALLFGGADTEVQPGYVSSIQLRNGRLSDAEIVRLGGPSPHKIPGCIRVSRESGNVVVRWTGGVILQSASEITGPWSDIPTASTPYTVPGPLPSKLFFRPKS